MNALSVTCVNLNRCLLFFSVFVVYCVPLGPVLLTLLLVVHRKLSLAALMPSWLMYFSPHLCMASDKFPE